MGTFVGTDQHQMKTMLIEAISLLCKNSLGFEEKLTVEGLLGITLDSKDIILVNIHETLMNGKQQTVEEFPITGYKKTKCINNDTEPIVPELNDKNHIKVAGSFSGHQTRKKKQKRTFLRGVDRRLVASSKPQGVFSEKWSSNRLDFENSESIQNNRNISKQNDSDFPFIKQEVSDNSYESSMNTQEENTNHYDEAKDDSPDNGTERLPEHLNNEEDENAIATGNSLTFESTYPFSHNSLEAAPMQCLAESPDLGDKNLTHTNVLCLPSGKSPSSNKKQLSPDSDKTKRRKRPKRNSNIYVCQHCDRCYKSESVYNDHMKKHLGIHRYPCPYCDRGFRTKDCIEGHLVQCHNYLPKNQCKICKRIFGYRRVCRKHIQQRHNIENASEFLHVLSVDMTTNQYLEEGLDTNEVCIDETLAINAVK